MAENYGVITEQGDLGLGFNPLSGEEKEAIKKSITEAKKESEKEEQ